MYCGLKAWKLTYRNKIFKILLLWPDLNFKRLWDFKNISRRCQISFLMLRSRKMKVLEMKKGKIKFSKKSPFWAPNPAWLYILVRSLREQSLKKIVFSVRKKFFCGIKLFKNVRESSPKYLRTFVESYRLIRPLERCIMLEMCNPGYPPP